MIKISNIYVSTTGSLLLMINMFWCRKKIQHSMLANTYYNKISIENYKQEILKFYVIIMCIFHKFIEYNISGSNIQY